MLIEGLSVLRCICCSTWEEMTADEKHPISQFPDQHANSDQLIALQSPCMYNLPQPSMAIMDATLNLNLDLSPASIPSFGSFSGVSASHPQHHPHYQMVGQPSPTSSPGSHLGCMESVTGAPVQQQHACTARTAAEKSGKTAASVHLHVFPMLPETVHVANSACFLGQLF